MKQKKPPANDKKQHSRRASADFINAAEHAPGYIMTKLETGKPGDRFEIEAERTADMIMQSGDNYASPVFQEGQAHQKPITPWIKQVNTKPERHTPSGNTIPSGSWLEAQLSHSKGDGMPLPEAPRSFMESRFGTDFSHVRIHTGNQAKALSRSFNAKAFTHGNDIYFNQGKYNPESSNGKHLLAHELTHVLQQNNIAKSTNGTNTNLVQRDPEQEITFEEGASITGHVRDLGPNLPGGGVTLVRDVDNIVERLKTGWQILGTNYLGAIANFRDYMGFSSSAEAQADYLKVSLKFAGEQLMKAAIDQFKNRIPGLDIAVDFFKEMMDEHDRAAGAQREVVVRDFIVNYRTRVLELISQQKLRLDPLKQQFLENLQRHLVNAPEELHADELATPQTTETQYPREVIAGPAAEYLNSLDASVEDFRSALPSSTAFLRKILEAWVKTRESVVESAGGGSVYMGGRIYLKVKMYKDDNSWTTESPTEGRLAAPEANRTADALERVMQEQNITVNDLAIRKVLTIEVEDEVRGFNDNYRVHLHYIVPGRILYNSGGIPPRITRAYLVKANIIAAEAVRRLSIGSINVTSLKAY